MMDNRGKEEGYSFQINRGVSGELAVLLEHWLKCFAKFLPLSYVLVSNPADVTFDLLSSLG